MIKTTAVNLVNPEPMMVTWDIGRRCNYDCTYCEATRHDNKSPHHSLDELKTTFEFIKSWTEIYNSHRAIHTTNINFTGGEPTVNPNFWKLVDYVKQYNFNLSLTTNGAWNKKHTKTISEKFSGVTVSYHAEADPSLKNQVVENILELSKTDIWLQVNVMLHVDHWDECVSVYNLLKEKGIRVSPRPIGDGNVSRVGWFIDSDGKNRRTSHQYSEEQQTWFWNQMSVDKQASKSQSGDQLGRGCCGGRCLTAKVENQWQEVKLIDTNFKDWYCTVDWYFLHIDQHTGLIYHHQTCQALHNKQRGALGNIKDSDTILEDLKSRMKDPQPIVCPNNRCGCGMCVPKAQDKDVFTVMWNNILKAPGTRETL
jgi:MoaA/NifB/PqqE/SkfB family radical SAM enzyme